MPYETKTFSQARPIAGQHRFGFQTVGVSCCMSRRGRVYVL